MKILTIGSAGGLIYAPLHVPEAAARLLRTAALTTSFTQYFPTPLIASQVLFSASMPLFSSFIHTEYAFLARVATRVTLLCVSSILG